MTVQTILRFPDHHLRATAQRVLVFDEYLCSLATDLLDTLRAASAIGITAPHIGVLKRLAVIELAAAEGVRTYVNPQILWASADMIRHEEGSVSMPGVTEEIERHARVRMSYQDLSGVEMVEEADGLISVSLQPLLIQRLCPGQHPWILISSDVAGVAQTLDTPQPGEVRPAIRAARGGRGQVGLAVRHAWNSRRRIA